LWDRLPAHRRKGLVAILGRLCSLVRIGSGGLIVGWKMAGEVQTVMQHATDFQMAI
jgi:hypothetical protein